jgi:ActR/RegA family two-component response regulator
MPTGADHPKKILLVDDRPSRPLIRRLEGAGYLVTGVESYQQAVACLDSDHFHLAIIDIRLEDADAANIDGMKLLGVIATQSLHGVMPCIVLTAYPNINNILTATQTWRVARFIQKQANYITEVLTTVEKLFEEQVKINFALEYEISSHALLTEIAQDIRWSTGFQPPNERLELQIRDLFGKLFVDAKRIYVTKLKPGLTGASVSRVDPTWALSPGPACVVKAGLLEKIETENQHYNKYVREQLNNAVTKVDVAYTRHLGALRYTFAQSGAQALVEFDEYYANSTPKEILYSLDYLFYQACRYWYDNHGERRYQQLAHLYYQAFELDVEKLINRIQLILPQFDPTAATFQLAWLPNPLPNPIFWLAKRDNECILPVFATITHGDLTGRNIMVNEEGRCWLIDFYRTYPSHILRDFLILESDIKYRLLAQPSNKDFLLLEAMLLHWQPDQGEIKFASAPRDMAKAIQVVANLRKIAYELGKGTGTTIHKEYLISLLMATLNVVRLRHIPDERKMQAMLSAALICAELDKLAGREPECDINDLLDLN